VKDRVEDDPVERGWKRTVAGDAPERQGGLPDRRDAVKHARTTEKTQEFRERRVRDVC
jgi:hypothetical protein